MGADSRIASGTILGGKFRIRRLLGQGGMGEVYAGEGRRGEKVAIKVLHDRAAQDPDLVARFNREAEIARSIHSDYVAAVIGSGKEKDGRLWIAFERLVGEGLDERLRREQYLAFAEVAPIVDDSLKGLMAAHEAHVIHRDIKPANLFVEKRKLTQQEMAEGVHEERTRILDFGVSKLRAAADRKNEPSLTAFDATLGSFAYMAPEQVRGSARVDERADLYALGAVAFRALTGRLPFEGTNALTLIALKLDRDPPSLTSTTGDEWPQAIERFLGKLMARDRENRFRTAEETLFAWRKVSNTMDDVRRRVPPSEQHDDRADATQGTFADDYDIPPFRR